MKSKSAVIALASIAQESRLAIFRVLVRAGPRQGLSAGKIAETTDIKPSALSFHLKELTNSKMVTAAPKGRFIIYTANFALMDALLAFLTENCCAGDSCRSKGK